MIKCKNCNTAFQSPYCPQCGQKSSTSPLTYKSLAQSILLSFGTIDRGILRTLVDLFIRPAHMAIEYVHGKRVTFFAPFQLLFILATIYMIVYYWSGASSDFILPEGVEKLISAKFQLLLTKSIRFFQNNRGIMWALCIPLQVLCFRMLYKQVRYRFTWVETCFIAAYFFSQITIVELTAFLINQAFPNFDFLEGGNMALLYLFLLGFDLKQLTGGTWKGNIIKCLTSQVLFFILLGLLATVVLSIALLTGAINLGYSLDHLSYCYV